VAAHIMRAIFAVFFLFICLSLYFAGGKWTVTAMSAVMVNP
jgi:hypothetical protein